jgi:hypothetical protein
MMTDKKLLERYIRRKNENALWKKHQASWIKRFQPTPKTDAEELVSILPRMWILMIFCVSNFAQSIDKMFSGEVWPIIFLLFMSLAVAYLSREIWLANKVLRLFIMTAIPDFDGLLNHINKTRTNQVTLRDDADR